MVRTAEQIELIDMTPQALRRRMAHGNVYRAEQVDAALSQYFREGNLTALRELSLLWLADRVDEGLDRYRSQHRIDTVWATRERIVVPVSGGPESDTLMRRAARIATRGAGGEWMGLYVSRRDGLRGVSPDQLLAMRRKAEDLGGAFHSIVGDNLPDDILDFARAENASQVVIGASRRSRLSALLRPGVGETVIADSGEIDVHIVTHEHAGRTGVRTRPPQSLGRARRLLGYVVGVLGPVMTSAALVATRGAHNLSTEALVFMTVVVATALVGGVLPAVLAAVLSGLLLNLLFTPPLFEPTISDPENALAIGLFVAVGIAVATVVDHAARLSAQARAARAEADALTVLAHHLLTATDDLAGLLDSAVVTLHARGAALLAGEGPATQVLASVGEAPVTLEAADMSAVVDEDTVLVLAGPGLPAGDRGLLRAYAAYARVIGERRVAARERADRVRLAEADRTRTALLAAVSHDLRSPPAAVKASVSSLRNDRVPWTDQDRAELLETAEEATDRLVALVSNLLDMSRIQTGVVHPIEAEIGLRRAVLRAIVDLPERRRIEVAIDEDVIVVADPGLLDRVIANICENALKYTPVDAAIRVDAGPAGPEVVLRIVDEGRGVKESEHELLFAPFQRMGDVPGQDGVGLGLAVARGLTEAMHGTITSEATPGGGLTFVVHLPAPEETR